MTHDTRLKFKMALLAGLLFASASVIRANGALAAETGAPKGEMGRWIESVTGMIFVRIPAGCYFMGQSDSEKKLLTQAVGRELYLEQYGDEVPRHEVCVDGFWLGKFEVTVAQYDTFVRAADYDSQNENTNFQWFEDQTAPEALDTPLNDIPGFKPGAVHPVVRVTWQDAKAMAEWLTRNSPGRYRLPTEAEWEYAARAGTTTIRFWGDAPDSACRYANVADKAAKTVWPDWSVHDCNDGYAALSPVGSFRPNAFGLHDMLGNVWEWCEDVYSADAYEHRPKSNPSHSAGTLIHVLRGGGWSVAQRGIRCANRDWDLINRRDEGIGFRLLRSD